MKKIAALLLGVLLAATMFVGCEGNRGDDVSISVALVDGAPLLTMTKMMKDDFAVKNGYDISYATHTDSNTLVASLMKEEIDFAIAPINVAAMVHAKGMGYRLAAVTVWGITHIVSNQNISSLEDLAGEIVFAFAKNGTPGITLRAVLEQNGIEYVDYSGTPDDNKVNIVYLATASDVRNAMVNGTIDGITVKHGLLAEPVATAVTGATKDLAHGPYAAKINIQTEWAKNNDGIYPQAGLIFHERLLQNDKDFVDKFIAMVELSSMYAKNNPKAAGDMAKALGSTGIPNGDVVEAAMKANRLPLDFTPALNSKNAVTTYLQVLFNESSDLVGGSMPSDSFYYGAA